MSVGKTNFAYCTTSSSGTYVEVPAKLIKSNKQSNESLASEDSGRTDDGVMHITWIKNKLRKWEIELVPCTPSEFSSIINALQGQEYWVNIYDPSSNTTLSGLHVYTSNSEAECYSGVLLDGLYQGVSFSIIEMGD